MSNDEQAIREVLARYVRAADRRDGVAMGSLFLPEGKVQIFYGRGETAELLGELVGRDAIAHAVTGLMEPHPEGGWSHHTTHDAVVEVDGDRAMIDAQYVVFQVRAHPKPAGGWPPSARGAQGTVTPIESGYYRASMVRVSGAWKIAAHRIDGDLPMAFPSGDGA